MRRREAAFGAALAALTCLACLALGCASTRTPGPVPRLGDNPRWWIAHPVAEAIAAYGSPVSRDSTTSSLLWVVDRTAFTATWVRMTSDAKGRVTGASTEAIAGPPGWWRLSEDWRGRTVQELAAACGRGRDLSRAEEQRFGADPHPRVLVYEVDYPTDFGSRRTTVFLVSADSSDTIRAVRRLWNVVSE